MPNVFLAWCMQTFLSSLPREHLEHHWEWTGLEWDYDDELGKKACQAMSFETVSNLSTGAAVGGMLM